MAAFEKEFPGASWLSAQVFRELEVVGGLAEALIASVARRHGLSHAALNALAVIEGNGALMAAGVVGAQMHMTSGTMTSVSTPWSATGTSSGSRIPTTAAVSSST